MVAQRMDIRNIWMLSREYGRLAGAGGVKDVVCQLAEALARWNGRSVSVVLPRYGFLDAGGHGFEPLCDPLHTGKVLRLSIDMHEPDRYVREVVTFQYCRMNRVHLYLVEAERFRQKNGVYTYSEEDERKVWWQKRSTGHHDYFAMNLLLQKAALELAVVLGQLPDVFHCHDGHTAILPGLLRECGGYRSYFRATGCLVTIHNAGLGYHQEIADIPYAVSTTGLPPQVVDAHQLDRKFDPFLLAGSYAMLNTVSENYALELQQSDNDRLTGWLGHELLRRNVVLDGVTNGVEPRAFSADLFAADDETLAYDPGDQAPDLPGKLRCKQWVLHSLAPDVVAEHNGFAGLERFGHLTGETGKPLFTFIGRLSEQKGVDLLLEVAELFLETNEQAQFLVFGSGASDLEQWLISLAGRERLRGRFCYLRGFDVEAANRVYSAGDFFVIPSRYEPCGLTDFIAQLFGNIPIVHHVGGLVKVVDGVTGIAYRGDGRDELLSALLRAVALYRSPEELRQMQRAAVVEITRKYTWDKVMKSYLQLYRRAVELQRDSESWAGGD